jgi:hypothetical protein
MTANRRRWRVIAGLLAGVMIGTLALTACGSASDGAAPGGAPMRDADGAPNAGGDAVTGGGAAPPAGEAPQPAPQKVEIQERSLIYTGSITIRVDNVVEAADKAVDIATGMGGVVGGDRRTLDSDRSAAQLVLRIPADKFSATLSELARQLGEEESRSVQTQDVTETLVDLDARLATQRASVTRVRALLERARTIGEVVSIESELTRREAELASLEQRKEQLAGLVALSTITVDLRGPEAPGAPVDEEDIGFVTGLKAGWEGFLTSVKVVLTVAGWLLPWVIAIGLPVWLMVWVLRRRPRASRAPAIEPSAPPPPPPSAAT